MFSGASRIFTKPIKNYWKILFASLAFYRPQNTYTSSKKFFEIEEFSENDIETTIPKIFFATEQAEFSPIKVNEYLFYQNQIVSGLGNRDLAVEIASHLDVQLMRLVLKQFADGESFIQFYDFVRNKPVFVIQSIEPPQISDRFMELLLAVSTLKRCSAGQVITIIPYIAFGRKRGQLNQPLFQAQTFAQLLASTGCDVVITLNFEMKEIKGFFPNSCQILNIDVLPLAIPYYKEKQVDNPILISDSSNAQQMKRAENLRNEFLAAGVNCSLAFINENSDSEESRFTYIGENVNSRNCIIIDTMFKNIPMLIEKVDSLKNRGAESVFCYCVHGAFSEEEIKLIEKSKIDEVLTTNTVSSLQLSEKIKFISVGKLLSEIISVISSNQSLEENRLKKSVIKYFESFNRKEN